MGMFCPCQGTHQRSISELEAFFSQLEELYPPDVRTGKISWEIEMKANSKAKNKIPFSWTDCNNVVDENTVLLLYYSQDNDSLKVYL